MEKNSLETKKEISRLCSLTGNMQKSLDLEYSTPENDCVREMMRETSLVEEPVIPLFPLLEEKRNKGKSKEESYGQCGPKIKLLLEEPQVDTMINTDPFLPIPLNMINLTWAEKGKGKATWEVILPEKPKIAINKGVVLCSRCQCECEPEVPTIEAILDQELIMRREKEEHENRANVIRAVKKETSRNVFQRLGRNSQPKNLSEVFRNYEASEEVENKEAKTPRWVDVRPPQPSYASGDIRMKGRTQNPVTKNNLARLR
ncbi:receptor-like protein 12 [Pyrus ussuriensis x Pyrus communis]|uniref:Receptor-like protein 12 n=1 Tax=Pyrus ussuriensis x Pyrus communis TaxID=2448454 RepID=A0A5N5GW59_9ROSA|nr:receptor-like protein 12 [Pyrus ussuriensis x Pyrus communis]